MENHKKYNLFPVYNDTDLMPGCLFLPQQLLSILLGLPDRKIEYYLLFAIFSSRNQFPSFVHKRNCRVNWSTRFIVRVRFNELDVHFFDRFIVSNIRDHFVLWNITGFKSFILRRMPAFLIHVLAAFTAFCKLSIVLHKSVYQGTISFT